MHYDFLPRHSVFTLLQKQNIRRNLCSGVFLKSVIRQADSTDIIPVSF